jgi:hypothetical protein
MKCLRSGKHYSFTLVHRRRKNQQHQPKPGQPKIQGVSGAGDPDDDPEPGKSRPWLWRVMRAALPFQMASVALFCVACLLEPHCCDAINNLNLSLTPQLRYVRGPPPVWTVNGFIILASVMLLTVSWPECEVRLPAATRIWIKIPLHWIWHRCYSDTGIRCWICAAEWKIPGRLYILVYFKMTHFLHFFECKTSSCFQIRIFWLTWTVKWVVS